MKTRWLIVTLTACIAASLYLRIALPYDNVFTGQWIKFTSIDAYWQMFHVDKMAPDFPAYISQIFNVPLFQWLLSGVIWCIGLGNPTQATIDTVAVYFPPILAALTIVPVYFIGRMLFNRYVGIIAAALIAVLPGEWLGRSTLGFTDHHVAEVLFSTTAIMFFLLAIKTENKRRIAHSILAALFIFSCVYSWTSGILIAGIVIVYLVIQIAIGQQKYYMKLYWISTLFVFSALGLFLIIKPQFISVMWTFVTTSPTITTTMEMRPLFFPAGQFTPLVAWGNFTTLMLITPIAMGILLFQARRNSNAMFLLIWTVVMLVAMLWFRRFAYYFAVNAALLGGFMAWWLWSHIKERVSAIVISGTLICIMIFPSINAAMITASNVSFAPSDAWMKALEWTKNNTPEDSVILAWWDYGYWINRESKRLAYTNPGQDVAPIVNAVSMFLSPSENYTVEADYIIIDRNTVMGKFWAVATWAGENPLTFSDFYYIAKDNRHQQVQLFHPEYYQSLVVRLYNFDGQAVTPTQSTVIGITLGGKVLSSLDVYGSYEEAAENLGIGERLVGTHAFISPVPLEKVDGYSLVYQSDEKIDGVPEVKIFRKEVR